VTTEARALEAATPMFLILRQGLQGLYQCGISRQKQQNASRRHDGTGVGQLGAVINTDIGSVGCRAPQRRQTDELTGQERLLPSLRVCVCV